MGLIGFNWLVCIRLCVVVVGFGLVEILCIESSGMCIGLCYCSGWLLVFLVKCNVKVLVLCVVWFVVVMNVVMFSGLLIYIVCVVLNDGLFGVSCCVNYSLVWVLVNVIGVVSVVVFMCFVWFVVVVLYFIIGVVWCVWLVVRILVEG